MPTFYGNPADQLHLIGITGTKGKTTTALLTAAIMTEAGLPCAYIGSNGVDIAGVHEATANTTPESLELHRLFRKMLDAGVRHCRAGGQQPGPAPPPRGRRPL